MVPKGTDEREPVIVLTAPPGRKDSGWCLLRGGAEHVAQGAPNQEHVERSKSQCFLPSLPPVSVKANTPLTDLSHRGLPAFTMPASSRISLGCQMEEL
jgi:hypothetical protein